MPIYTWRCFCSQPDYWKHKAPRTLNFWSKVPLFCILKKLTKTSTNQPPQIFKRQIPVFNSINIWYKIEILIVFGQGTNGSKERCKLDRIQQAKLELLCQHLSPCTAGTTLEPGLAPKPGQGERAQQSQELPTPTPTTIPIPTPTATPYFRNNPQKQ